MRRREGGGGSRCVGGGVGGGNGLECEVEGGRGLREVVRSGWGVVLRRKFQSLYCIQFHFACTSDGEEM